MAHTRPPGAACPLPRWPAVTEALHARGWKAHHLARSLGRRPARVLALLYGQAEPDPATLHAIEKTLDLAPGSLS